MEQPAPHIPTLIVMAGLPGTGKSTLAAELAKRLPAPVLCKDEFRAALFRPEAVRYSREQDDLCMEVIFLVVQCMLRSDHRQPIIIDGRTFSRSSQVAWLMAKAGSINAQLIMIECVCDDAIAKQRLEDDQRRGAHSATNRSYDLYRELKETADPITIERLVINTGREPLERSVERCRAYVKRSSPAGGSSGGGAGDTPA